MPRLIHRPPKLRRHKARNLACVVLNGQTLYLGKWGSAAAKQAYARILGEWKAGAAGQPPGHHPVDLSVAELMARFVTWAKSYYRQSQEYSCIVYSLRTLKLCTAGCRLPSSRR